MPPGSHTNTMSQRQPTLSETWEILWNLLTAPLWFIGARKEHGKACWAWKRTVVHLIIDLAVCTTGFFIKDTIYNALTTPTTIPSPVFLNVTVNDDSDIKAKYRVIRDTNQHSHSNSTLFVDLTALIPPPTRHKHYDTAT